MSEDKKCQENHAEHDCGHDHGHDHGHGHDHSNCGHNHSHNAVASHGRFFFTESEIQAFQSLSIEELMHQADDFLSEEEFGKVVPIFEIALSKMHAKSTHNSEDMLELTNIMQNLAFSYGIIGEHQKAIPLWKEVIAYKEKDKEDISDLLDDYFGIALSCEQCELDDDFLLYIQKGLHLAKENQFEEYVASFEHELGGFYCDLADFNKSEEHFMNAIKIREKLNDVVGLVMSKMYMGILFQEQNKVSDAKQFYEMALALTKDENYADELAGERSELELRLSQVQNSSLKGKLLDL